MSTPVEALLHRLSRQCQLDGFRVSLSERCGSLHLHPGARTLPDRVTAVAFMTALSAGSIDLVGIYVGNQVVQTHQLIDAKRKWRTSTIAPAEREEAA